MGEIVELDWFTILSFGDLVLSSAIVIIAFSLLTYILTHNFTSSVARSFGVVLTCVLVVYAGDVLITLTEEARSAIPWLRLQWLGIAFLPAAYLHFSDSILRTTNVRSAARRALVLVAYPISFAFLALAIFSELLVRDGMQMRPIAVLLAGPLFPIFTGYFAFATIAGGINVLRARYRCLTPIAARRMTYLIVAYFAPALGVFPYFMVTSSPTEISASLILGLATVGNVGISVMLILMGYSVAYYGVLSPDRVVKQSLIHYLLRGPFVGFCVILAMLTIPRVERIIGLPRDTVLIFAVIGVIVLLANLVELFSPVLDRIIYRQDEEEISWLQELDKRLLTTTDLKQFLENLLTAMCELLRVRTAFIASVAGGQWLIETETGDRDVNKAFLHSTQVSDFVRPAVDRLERLEPSGLEFQRQNGFWLLPLRTRGGEAILGLLGLHVESTVFDLSEAAGEAVEALVSQAETALEDRQLQQGVFSSLRKIIPEIDRIQRWRGTVRYTARESLEVIEDSPVYAPEYQRWVKAALSHFWGGPKLSASPLLQLRVVAQRLQGHEGNPAAALRAVLAEAIEVLRPSGQRHMTASEWLLYNIIEMRYIQGRRVRDIADTLAMSESDLYRKQRVALEEVAKALAAMEQQPEP